MKRVYGKSTIIDVEEKPVSEEVRRFREQIDNLWTAKHPQTKYALYTNNDAVKEAERKAFGNNVEYVVSSKL